MSSSQPLEYASDPKDLAAPKSAMPTLWLIVFADMLGFGVIVPSLPIYATRYNASPFQVALLFSIFSLCQFIASPILGLISDRFGRRPVLAASQFGTVAGYVLLGWTMLYEWNNVSLALMLMYLSRVIDGISGGNISTAHAYIGDISTKENRAGRMGLLGAAFGIGFSAGPAIGGMLSFIHPSAPAFGAAGFALIACVMTVVLLPESRRRSHDEEEDWWHPSRFVPILTSPVVGQLLFIGFGAMLAFVMLEVIFALYLYRVFSFGQTAVNWFFALVGVVIMIVQAGLIGPLSRRFGEWRLTIAGPLIAAIAMALYTTSSYEPIVWIVIVASLLNATGRSLWFPTLNSLLSQSATPRTQGITFGVFHAMMSLARVIGPLIAGVLFERHVAGPFVVSGIILLAVAGWATGVWLRQRPAIPALAEPTL